MKKVGGRGSAHKHEDTVRHAYAKGTVVLRGLADQLSEICYDSRSITRDELRSLHGRLHEVSELLYWATLSDWVAVELSDLGSDDWNDADIDAFCDTYSDGVPVSRVEPAPEVNTRLLPDSFYEGDIPWSPNGVGISGDGVDVYPGCGPPPPGWRVIVNDPPHRRQLLLRVVGDPDSEYERMYRKVASWEESERD
jgi:hypothetical protein